MQVPMTREEALKKLNELRFMSDKEQSHIDADEVLCSLLSTLGFHDIVKAYDVIDKWYA